MAVLVHKRRIGRPDAPVGIELVKLGDKVLILAKARKVVLEIRIKTT